MERVGEKVDGLKTGLEERNRKEGEELKEEGGRVERVITMLKDLGDHLGMVEGSLRSMMKKVHRVGLSTDERLVERREDLARKERLRKEEREAEQEMEDATDELF
ncbi:hypothetical protein HOY80DRAFT_1065177 [Tuber brumale]|nr:hypothetical protein HOY80DRAFT_1065177 [Tuber brumale]